MQKTQKSKVTSSLPSHFPVSHSHQTPKFFQVPTQLSNPKKLSSNTARRLRRNAATGPPLASRLLLVLAGPPFTPALASISPVTSFFLTNDEKSKATYFVNVLPTSKLRSLKRHRFPFLLVDLECLVFLILYLFVY